MPSPVSSAHASSSPQNPTSSSAVISDGLAFGKQLEDAQAAIPEASAGSADPSSKPKAGQKKEVAAKALTAPQSLIIAAEMASPTAADAVSTVGRNPLSWSGAGKTAQGKDAQPEPESQTEKKDPVGGELLTPIPPQLIQQPIVLRQLSATPANGASQSGESAVPPSNVQLSDIVPSDSEIVVAPALHSQSGKKSTGASRKDDAGAPAKPEVAPTVQPAAVQPAAVQPSLVESTFSDQNGQPKVALQTGHRGEEWRPSGMLPTAVPALQIEGKPVRSGQQDGATALSAGPLRASFASGLAAKAESLAVTPPAEGIPAIRGMKFSEKPESSVKGTEVAVAVKVTSPSAAGKNNTGESTPEKTPVRVAPVRENRRATPENAEPIAPPPSPATRSTTWTVPESSSSARPAQLAAAETVRPIVQPSRLESLPSEEVAPKAAGPLKNLSIQVAQNGQQKVELQVQERSGELLVAVRSGDADVVHGLRQGLPELVNRMEQSGFRSEGWRPSGVVAAEAPSDAARQSTSGHRNGDSQPQPGFSQHDREQHEQRRPSRPEWVEEFENSQSDGKRFAGELYGFSR